MNNTDGKKVKYTIEIFCPAYIHDLINAVLEGVQTFIERKGYKADILKEKL